jgi:hypothetical protein
MEPTEKNFRGLRVEYKAIGKSTSRFRRIDWQSYEIDCLIVIQLLDLIPTKLTLNAPYKFQKPRILAGMNSIGSFKIGINFKSLDYISEGYFRCEENWFKLKNQTHLEGFVIYSIADRKFTLEIIEKELHD